MRRRPAICWRNARRRRYIVVVIVLHSGLSADPLPFAAWRKTRFITSVEVPGVDAIMFGTPAVFPGKRFCAGIKGALDIAIRYGGIPAVHGRGDQLFY
ncbi:hypothetical protein KCP78_25850 (plasmid) [Salmonella enterica subsp. enterica]|nr:hypothetical protein KCP78_25850 [Salmonella enterica subsp. enterica]